ncbi:MAG: response regulator [Patescibacteria group bacterium]
MNDAQTQSNNKNNTEESLDIQSGSGFTVLLVEDDKFLRDLLMRKLENENLKVEVASNGKEVFDKARECKPKLILLDLILPDMDGFQILDNLKQNAESKDIPVLVLSNLGQKDDIEKCMELGAADYLIKAHFTPRDIVAKIKKLLSVN